MPIQRPSLQKTLIQMDLNRFYDKPVTRVSAALLLSLLCVSFFALAAIKPTLETMAQLIKQIDEKKEIDQKLTQKITALSTAQRELSDKSSLFSMIDRAVPETPRFTELLTVFEKVASENSVGFGSVQIDQVPLESGVTGRAPGTLISYPMILTFSGEYENLLATLRQLQSMGRIVLVDRFDIAPQVQDTTAKNLNLTVSIRAFSFVGKRPIQSSIPPGGL